MVATLRHTSLRVEGSLTRHVLLLLDGTRNRAALLAGLAALVQSGVTTVHRDGVPVSNKQKAIEVLTEELGVRLTRVAHLALLVA